MVRDVIVVGGGIIGCAVASELARRGCRVQLVADRALGQGATQASGGMLVPFVEAHGGGPMLELGARSLALYDEFVERTRRDGVKDDEAFEYGRRGSLQVAFAPEDATALRDAAAHLARSGVRAEWLDARAVRRMEPVLSDSTLGGLLIGDHGVVGAETLTSALWSVATSHGARFFPARVTRVSREGGRVAIDASGGRLDADAVVIAAGAWASQIDIDGDGRVPVFPVRGQLLQLRWAGAPIRRILWGPRCYMVPWTDGRLLVGATAEQVGYDERNTAAGVHDLLDAASDLAPHAWTASFECARVGLRPGTPDGLPVLGRSPSTPGLVYATGHYRNGVLLAPVTATLIADLIAGEREDPLLQSFSVSRFGVANA